MRKIATLSRRRTIAVSLLVILALGGTVAGIAEIARAVYDFFLFQPRASS